VLRHGMGSRTIGHSSQVIFLYNVKSYSIMGKEFVYQVEVKGVKSLK
jgi:hypothetical protein